MYVLCLDINAVDNNVEQKYLFDQQVIRKITLRSAFLSLRLRTAVDQEGSKLWMVTVFFIDDDRLIYTKVKFLDIYIRHNYSLIL